MMKMKMKAIFDAIMSSRFGLASCTLGAFVAIFFVVTFCLGVSRAATPDNIQATITETTLIPRATFVATSASETTHTKQPTRAGNKTVLSRRPAFRPTATPIPTPVSLIATPAATRMPTAAPAPSITDGIKFEETADTPQARYQQALANGEVRGPRKKHLTKTAGVFKGPSGRETYYNLKMDLVVKYMRNKGFKADEYPYWVRDDGVKMLGNYVIVAADLKTRPKGPILECSLGTAIVCDTGGFVKKYPNGLDIAVDWKI